MTLMGKMSRTFDDSNQRVLAELSALDNCFEFVVRVLITGDDNARASKNLS